MNTVKYSSPRRIESEHEIFGVLHAKYPWLREALKDEKEKHLVLSQVSDWFRRLRTLDPVSVALYARGLKCYDRMGFNEIHSRENSGGYIRSTRTLNKRLSGLKSLDLVSRSPERGGPGRRGAYHFCLPAIIVDEARLPVDLSDQNGPVYFAYGETTFRIQMMVSEFLRESGQKKAGEIVERLLEVRSVADQVTADLLSASLTLHKRIARQYFESERQRIEAGVTTAYWDLMAGHAEEAAKITQMLRERLPEQD